MIKYKPILIIDEGIILSNLPFIEFIKVMVFHKIELKIWLYELKYRIRRLRHITKSHKSRLIFNKHRGY